MGNTHTEPVLNLDSIDTYSHFTCQPPHHDLTTNDISLHFTCQPSNTHLTFDNGSLQTNT